MVDFESVRLDPSKFVPSASPALSDSGGHLVFKGTSEQDAPLFSLLTRATIMLQAQSTALNSWGHRIIFELNHHDLIERAHLIHSEKPIVPSHFSEPENFWPVDAKDLGDFKGAPALKYVGPNLPHQLEIGARKFDLVRSNKDVTQGDGLHFIITPNSADLSEPSAVTQGAMALSAYDLLKNTVVNRDQVVIVINSPEFRKKSGAPCHIHLVFSGPNNIVPNFETPWANV